MNGCNPCPNACMRLEQSFAAPVSKVLLVTSIACAAMGILAISPLTYLHALSSYWYTFEIGAFVSFIGALYFWPKKEMSMGENLDTEKEGDKSPGDSRSLLEGDSVDEIYDLRKARFLVNNGDALMDLEMNCESAFEQYEQAALMGHVEAMMRLAKCYEDGKVCQKDIDKAQKYYKMAADKDDLEAVVTLAIFALDAGNTNNTEKWNSALLWLNKAESLDKKGKVKEIAEQFKQQRPSNASISTLKTSLRPVLSLITFESKFNL